MNVEKLQQINAMASELKKHHFAVSNDEAVSQAEELYVPKQEQELHAPAQPPVVRETKLAERRFELLIEMNNKKFEEQLQSLQQAVNTTLQNVTQELVSVKAELAKLKEQRPKEVQKELKPAPAQESHPRQGDFTSDDVDIQKMFYFGNK